MADDSFGGRAFNAARLTAINGKCGVASSVKSLRAVSAPAIMRPSLIKKDPSLFRVRPHLADWAQTSRDFRWDDARRQLAGLPGGGLNIAFEAVGRHAHGPRADRIAIAWLGQEGGERSLSYADLDRASSRFANVLVSLGVGRGDVVFLLLPRIPDVHVCVLGALKAGAVVSPLFSAFGPEPVATRLNIGRGKVLVTTRALYERKVLPIRDRVPSLQHVLLAGAVRQRDGRAAGHARPRRADGAGVRGVRHRADAARGPGAAALHQRDHRQAERRRCTCTTPSSPTGPRRASRSTCTTTISSGARPIPAG